VTNRQTPAGEKGTCRAGVPNLLRHVRNLRADLTRQVEWPRLRFANLLLLTWIAPSARGISGWQDGSGVTEKSATHADDLETLATSQFGKLSEAELRLVRAAPRGEVAYCGQRGKIDPSKSQAWLRDREIRAGLIRWLCADTEASKRVDPKGILIFAAKITGDLDLLFVAVPFPLGLKQCSLTGDSIFTSIRIPALDLGGCSIKSLRADSAGVRGLVLLDRISSQGTVTLRHAQIGGDLICRAATLESSTGIALDASGAEINGSVFLDDGFSATGAVELAEARISGQLNCGDGTFSNPHGFALFAESVEVKDDVKLVGDFNAEGEVSLSGAQIGHDVQCEGRFENPGGTALNFENARVGGHFFLRGNFRAKGDNGIDLAFVQIAGNLECDGARFDLDGWLRLDSVRIRGTFQWFDIGIVSTTMLGLMNSSVGNIIDAEKNWPKSWPVKGNLTLDGFVYERILVGPTDAEARLQWLDLAPVFTPQPYRQLAKVLRERGDEEGAKQVLFEMEGRARAKDRARLVHAPIRWLGHFTKDTLYKTTTGYGIYPGAAIGELLGLTALGWILYRRAQRVGAMAPTEKDAYTEFRASGQAPVHYPPFNPLIYSLENCVPLVKFGQDDRWQPDPNPRRPLEGTVLSANWRVRLKNMLLVRLPDRATSPVALRWCRWIMICLGWLLTTFLLAAVTGLIKTG
jgi:hypothetical protein